MAFLLQALTAVNDRLKPNNTHLIIRHGEPETVFGEIIAETDAKRLYFNADYTPFAVKRDQSIVENISIEVQSFDDALLIPPGEILKDDGDPYVVFTPFKKRWNTQPKPNTSNLELSSEHFYDVSHLKNDGIPTWDDLNIPDRSSQFRQQQKYMPKIDWNTSSIQASMSMLPLEIF